MRIILPFQSRGSWNAAKSQQQSLSFNIDPCLAQSQIGLNLIHYVNNVNDANIDNDFDYVKELNDVNNVNDENEVNNFNYVNNLNDIN